MLGAEARTHRFKVGERVRIARPASANPANTVETFLNALTSTGIPGEPDETWEVVRLRPADEAGFQYQVRCLRDGHDRVVHEEQLDPAG